MEDGRGQGAGAPSPPSVRHEPHPLGISALLHLGTERVSEGAARGTPHL